MAGNSNNLYLENQIGAFPYVIATLDAAVRTYLDDLPLPDFGTVEDTAALWATRARVKGGTTPGSAYVVSAEALKRIKALRY